MEPHQPGWPEDKTEVNFPACQHRKWELWSSRSSLVNFLDKSRSFSALWSSTLSSNKWTNRSVCLHQCPGRYWMNELTCWTRSNTQNKPEIRLLCLTQQHISAEPNSRQSDVTCLYWPVQAHWVQCFSAQSLQEKRNSVFLVVSTHTDGPVSVSGPVWKFLLYITTLWLTRFR